MRKLGLEISTDTLDKLVIQRVQKSEIVNDFDRKHARQPQLKQVDNPTA